MLIVANIAMLLGLFKINLGKNTYQTAHVPHSDAN